MAYRARIGETPQSLSNSDLTERIEQLRTSATDAYRQGDLGAMESWLQIIERYKAVATERGLI